MLDNCEIVMIKSDCYLAINDCRKTEVVKDFCAVPPHSHRAVLSKALVVEPVDLSDLTRFVVPSD